MRAIIAGRPWPALLLAFAILAARLATPAGFMPMQGPAGVTLVPCSGMGPMVMAHGEGHRPDKGRHHPQPCGFAALADVATGGAAAVLLPVALVYFVATPASSPFPGALIRPAARLRPPLRAPPA